MAGPMGTDTADYSDSGDSFGSGLNFGLAAPAAPSDAGAEVPPAPVVQPVPTANTPDNAGVAPPKPQERGGIFGSGLTFGASYHTPDPAMSALDQSADMLNQRVARANQIATNPILQFFNPEGVQKARDFIPQAAETLQKIRTQQAGMMAGKQQAATLGISDEVPDEATQADRVQVATAKALKGDLRTFKGLQIVDPKAAEAIAPQVLETVGGHLSKAQLAFDSLASMPNQGQYTAKLEQLRKDGTLTDLEALGLKVTPSFDTFNAAKGTEGQILREARQGLNDARNKLELRNTAQPMEEKEAKTYETAWKTVYGDDIKGQPSRIAATGARGNIIDGYDDPRKLGKGAVLATPDQRKSIKEDAELAVSKEDMEKFRANNRTYNLATMDKDGNRLPEGKINTNPNVQQGIAEGLASALRGGSGGANVGLLKIETSKRGYIQGLLDNIKSNYAGAINTLSEKEVRPYLTNMTQAQQRDVLDYLHAYNAGDIPDRLATTAKRAGALGLDAGALGIGKAEAGKFINDAIEEGRQAQIALDMRRHQAIGGGRGMLAYGALKPAETEPTTGVQGTQPTTVLPPPGVQTPVQQAQQPAPTGPGGAPQPPPVQPPAAQAPQQGTPPAPQPGPAGGTPASTPVTIAGQQVNVPPLPPGASPQYLAKTQRIESGRERDPWKAGAGNGPDGKPLSSAKGAFQFIDSTWAADKPPGAPNNPAEATPQQQADAAATRATKNAAVLSKSGVPVNDTNLYITHNLGEGAGPKLLKADPDADARTIVGERAARNNPLFFRGKPTVATVLARYDAEVNRDEPGPKPGAGGGGATAEQPPTFMQRIASTMGKAAVQSVPGPVGAAATLYSSLPPGAQQAVRDTAVEHAPAIGSTAGAVVGTGVAGPLGGVAGGAAGGGAGQSFKDYMQGRDQNPTEIAKQTALGGVLSVASEARPVIAAAGRVLGSGAVEGGAAVAEGKETADVIDAAGKGGAFALGGEALGKFISSLGPAAHKLFSKFTPDAQAELSAQAGKLVAARKVLETEQPKLAGEGAGVNPKYEAAKLEEEKASQYIKDHGQKPDDMAYAYEQTKAGTSAGEASVMRKAANEKADIGAGYDKLRQDVREATPGQKNLKPQSVPDGPVSMLRTGENPTGKVPEAFRADAEHAEMLVTAPAKDWAAKWDQLQNAGSELIKKRMSFLANNDKPSAEAMDTLFQGVRNQQKAAAKIVFGDKRGAEVISHLENLDKRYAKIMNATQGMNYEKMRSIIQGGNTAERRELEANFKEFAKDDPSAIRAFNAMKAGAQGRMGEEAKLMLPVIAGEFAANAGGIPTIGLISAAIGGHRMYALMQQYMNAKVLGKPVTFKDFFIAHMKPGGEGANAVREAVQKGAVMQ